MKRWGIILCLLGLHASAQVNCITTPDQLGPYFKHGAPLITNDTLAPGIQDSSRALKLNFYVSYDCDTVDLDTLPSPYALELWHANAQGEYSNVDGNPNDFAYRGRLVLSGKTSTLYTELPGIYPWRPSHIHVKGFLTNAWFTDTIVTQLYFKGDSLIASDPAKDFPERWIPLDTTANGYEGSFAFGLSYIVGMEEQETVDVQISPNPSDGILHLRTRFPGTVILMNNQGQTLYSQRVDSGASILDVSFLPKGFYVLVVGGEYHRIVLQ
jgi:hypothetical protein